MAVVTLKSGIITNRDATPKVITDAYVSAGDIRESWGYVLTGAADNAASKYILCTVPSNARMSAVDFQCSGLGTSAALNVGIYYPSYIPVDSGIAQSLANTAINTTVFASALSVAAAVESTNLLSNARVAINLQDRQLWQLAGLSADPGFSLDVVCAVSTATQAAGYVGVKARYVF